MSWGDKFRTWAPTETEQEKCENAGRIIRKAIDASEELRERNVVVFPQGSYRNRTNVRQDSDVDICVMCQDSFFFDLPDGMAAIDFGLNTPAAYSYAQFKNDVGTALTSYLGAGAVTRGGKAFDVHQNNYRVDADVVACFEMRRYRRDGTYIEGTSFAPDAGGRIQNWPRQHYDNGVAKNEATNRSFKAGVRILKNLRSEMADEGIAEAKPIPSYLIECLMWNVPNEGFALREGKAFRPEAEAYPNDHRRTTRSCSFLPSSALGRPAVRGAGRHAEPRSADAQPSAKLLSRPGSTARGFRPRC